MVIKLSLLPLSLYNHAIVYTITEAEKPLHALSLTLKKLVTIFGCDNFYKVFNNALVILL